MKKSHLMLGVLAIAVIVAIAASRSSGTLAPESSVAAPAASSALSKIAFVTYDANGFTPRVLKIARGTTVRFINASGRSALRITPHADPAFNTSVYRGLEASRSIKRGGSFDVSVDQPGVWGYTNLNSPKLFGVLIVE